MAQIESKIMLEDSSDEESQYDRSHSESHDPSPKGHVVAGEAPDSDIEEEYVDAKPTIRSTPSPLPSNVATKADDHGPVPVSGSFLKSMDPYKYRKVVELNKSLSKGLSDSFLERLVLEDTKRLEKLSQNLSNSQMQMQEALLHARIGTGNLLKMQMEVTNFTVSCAQLERLRTKVVPTPL